MVDRNYMNEISKFPLLSTEEEKKCAENLKLFEDIYLLSRNKLSYDIQEIFDLDSVLFSCNKDNYKEVIESLIKFFKFKEEYKDIYSKLLKYKQITMKLNRPLTNEELITNFNIKSANKLSSNDLLNQVKKYIMYQSAFETLYNSNLRLVVSIALKYNYTNSSYSVMDLVNEGNLALRRAIQGYDGSVKFSTYATYSIERRIKSYTFLCKSPIISGHTLGRYYKYKLQIDNLLSENKNLSEEEIANKLNIQVKTVKLILSNAFEVSSLQETNRDNKEFYNNLSNEITSEDIVFEKFYLDLARKLLNELDDTDRKIIEYRYCFKCEKPIPYAKLSEKIGITNQGVRYREKIIISKMKKKIKEMGI